MSIMREQNAIQRTIQNCENLDVCTKYFYTTIFLIQQQKSNL